jgi:hypothetical protein
MKKVVISAAMMCLLAGMAGSCKKDECTGEITLSYQTFDAFGGMACENIINADTKGLNYVIDSQAGLESLVECNALPSIDFDTYTLLLGSYESDKDLTYKDQVVLKDCQTRKVTYRISYESMQHDSSMLVEYHAVIPKVPDDYEVQFEIQTWQIN